MGTAWKDKLSEAIWAYRTAYKTPLRMSPYQLVYGKTCHLPIKLEFKAHWAIKRWNIDDEDITCSDTTTLATFDSQVK